MTSQMVFFIILGVLAIACAALVVKLSRISHRIVAMAFHFFSVAGLYFLLGAEFLGIIQIVVYAGAVTILFIFGMMMTEHRNITFDAHPNWRHRALSIVAIGVLLILMLVGIFSLDVPAQDPQFIGSAEEIGLLLYSQYIIPFIGMAFLLTAALVGAIVLARREADE